MIDMTPKNWYRVGRGRVIQFYATDEEFFQVLESSLPGEFEPYSMIVNEMVKEGKIYVQVPSVFTIDRFLDYRSRGFWKFYILSRLLMPDFKVERGLGVDPKCSLSGLIEVQHGRMTRKDQQDSNSSLVLCDSNIGLVDKVENEETGEVIKYEDSLKIFKALKKVAKRILCYTSIETWKDGRTFESKSILMSEGIVEKYRAGEIDLWAKPGKKIR